MSLAEELERIAEAAREHAEPGEQLAGVIAAEPGPGRRLYLCAFDRGGRRTWVALDAQGIPVDRWREVREAVSIAALCEVAAERAGGGELEELRAELVALRLRENPPGIVEAEEAALALERVVGAPPRVASPAYLDDVGTAARGLERALGEDGISPFAEAMREALAAVEAVAADVQANYKRELAD